MHCSSTHCTLPIPPRASACGPTTSTVSLPGVPAVSSPGDSVIASPVVVRVLTIGVDQPRVKVG